MAISTTKLGIDATGDCILFSTWLMQVSDYARDDMTWAEADVAAEISRVEKETGALFPGYSNFPATLTLCEQFLRGSVDVDLLRTVTDRAKEDIERTKPFVRPFMTSGDQKGFSPPMAMMVFGCPAQLTDFIGKHIDPVSGLVTGVSPHQRNLLKSLVANHFSVLARSASTGLQPA